MGRPRILVIDDEQALRETVADTLRMDGLDVQTAADGREGLELIGRNPFDVIFCDLLMPNMDGQEFYE
jgi:CheY-like chemotaxis protein